MYVCIYACTYIHVLIFCTHAYSYIHDYICTYTHRCLEFFFVMLCKVVADGLRNTVGLSFDRVGNLWGVDNGADNLVRPDLGGDIHMDNPADELNLLLRYRDDSSSGKTPTAAPTGEVGSTLTPTATNSAEDESTLVPTVSSSSSRSPEGNLPHESGVAAHTYNQRSDRFSILEGESLSAAPTSALPTPSPSWTSLAPVSAETAAPSNLPSTLTTTTTTTPTTTTTSTSSTGGASHFGYPFCFTQYLLSGGRGFRGEVSLHTC